MKGYKTYVRFLQECGDFKPGQIYRGIVTPDAEHNWRQYFEPLEEVSFDPIEDPRTCTGEIWQELSPLELIAKAAE